MRLSSNAYTLLRLLLSCILGLSVNIVAYAATSPSSQKKPISNIVIKIVKTSTNISPAISQTSIFALATEKKVTNCIPTKNVIQLPTTTLTPITQKKIPNQTKPHSRKTATISKITPSIPPATSTTAAVTQTSSTPPSSPPTSSKITLPEMSTPIATPTPSPIATPAAIIAAAKTVSTKKISAINFTSEIQSLNSTVKSALKQNPEILKTIALADASAAAVKEVRGQFFPQINAGLSAGKENYNADDGTFENNLSHQDNSSAALIITQPLFSGFSTYNLLNQRREEKNAAIFNEKFTKEDLGLRAVFAYLNVMRFQDLYNLTLQNIIAKQQILDKIEKKVTGGAGAQADLDLAVARIAQSKTALHTIEGTEAVAIENFIKIMGFPPGQLILPEAPLLPKTRQIAENIATENNPALLATRANLNASEHAVSVAKSTFFPRVDFTLSGEKNNNPSGYQGQTKDVRGIVTFSYNIFSGGSDKATVDKASQFHSANLYNYYDTRRKVVENLNGAWDQLQTDKKSLVTIQQHVVSSAAVLEGYKLQYDLGRNSLINVLDMQNEVYQASANLINTEYAIITDSYEVLAAMGKLASSFNGRTMQTRK